MCQNKFCSFWSVYLANRSVHNWISTALMKEVYFNIPHIKNCLFFFAGVWETKCQTSWNFMWRRRTIERLGWRCESLVQTWRIPHHSSGRRRQKSGIPVSSTILAREAKALKVLFFIFFVQFCFFKHIAIISCVL